MIEILLLINFAMWCFACCILGPWEQLRLDYTENVKASKTMSQTRLKEAKNSVELQSYVAIVFVYTHEQPFLAFFHRSESPPSLILAVPNQTYPCSLHNFMLLKHEPHRSRQAELDKQGLWGIFFSVF